MFPFGGIHKCGTAVAPAKANKSTITQASPILGGWVNATSHTSLQVCLGKVVQSRQQWCQDADVDLCLSSYQKPG